MSRTHLAASDPGRATWPAQIAGAVGVLALVAAVTLLRARLNGHFDSTRQVVDVAEVPRPMVARVISLGHTEWMVDLLWVNATLYYGETLLARLPSRYVERYADTMEDLDPTFRRAYLWAATSLMYRVGLVTRDDLLRADVHLERGLRYYPLDPEISLQRGFVLAFELPPYFRNDPARRRDMRARGAEYIRVAAAVGVGPPWLALTASTLLEESGRADAAIAVLRDALVLCEDRDLRPRIDGRLRQLLARHARQDPFYESIVRTENARRVEFPYMPSALFDFVGPRVIPSS